MYLTAMTHRDELFKLTMRWMNDDFNLEDGNTISRIFLYESAISSMAIDRMTQFLTCLHNGPLQTNRINRKFDLRRQLIAHRPEQNPRMDALHREIQARAEKLAEHRAKAAGLPLNNFISSPSAMQDDFLTAEAAVVQRFRDKQVRIDPEALTINDIVGFKIIDHPKVLETIPQLLNQTPGIRVVEIEKHQGNYNAVNLLLDIDLPPKDILTARLQAVDWKADRLRGLDLQDITKNIRTYVNQGAESVCIEVILTTPEELIEAELGRSIHELRVLRLRQRQAYSGLLGQNAGYLVEYLLSLAASPVTCIPDIPIKLYGRYLPEEIAALKYELNGNTIDGGLLSTFSFRSAEQADTEHTGPHGQQKIACAQKYQQAE